MSAIIDDIERVLVNETELEATVKRISGEIDDYYADSAVKRGTKLLLLCILKGSVVFMGDLMKHVTLPVEIDFMKVSSYGKSTQSSGSVNIILDLYRTILTNTDISD